MMTGLFNFGTILPRLEMIYVNISSLNNISAIFGVGVNTPGSFMDNMYITILYETGFLGLFLFMVLIYKTMKKLCYIEKSDKIYQRENVFLHVVFISMTFSMHSGALLLSRFSIIIFIYIIICINKKYETIKNNISREKHD
jgi:O-antigen ligase